jgi:hypothetical protein
VESIEAAFVDLANRPDIAILLISQHVSPFFIRLDCR